MADEPKAQGWWQTVPGIQIADRRLRDSIVIPTATRAVVLQVRQGDESTEIPVDLPGKPRG